MAFPTLRQPTSHRILRSPLLVVSLVKSPLRGALIHPHSPAPPCQQRLCRLCVCGSNFLKFRCSNLSILKNRCIHYVWIGTPKSLNFMQTVWRMHRMSTKRKHACCLEIKLFRLWYGRPWTHASTTGTSKNCTSTLEQFQCPKGRPRNSTHVLCQNGLVSCR